MSNHTKGHERFLVDIQLAELRGARELLASWNPDEEPLLLQLPERWQAVVLRFRETAYFRWFINDLGLRLETANAWATGELKPSPYVSSLYLDLFISKLDQEIERLTSPPSEKPTATVAALEQTPSPRISSGLFSGSLLKVPEQDILAFELPPDILRDTPVEELPGYEESLPASVRTCLKRKEIITAELLAAPASTQHWKEFFLEITNFGPSSLQHLYTYMVRGLKAKPIVVHRPE